MSTDQIFDVMRTARTRLPGAIDDVIKEELAFVLQDLLTVAPLWYEDISVTVTPATNNYATAPAEYTYTLTPSGGSIVRLLFVYDLDGNQHPATMPVIPDLVVVSPPSASETWKARVQLKNSALDSVAYPVIPDWIVQKYKSEIVDGVLGRMMSQIAKPYSNPTLAALHLRKFRSACNIARAEAKKMNLFAAQSWSYPQTFNRSR